MRLDTNGRLAAALAFAGALSALLPAGAAAQRPACSTEPRVMAPALLAAQPPAALSLAQRQHFAGLVAALKRADDAGARLELGRLVRAAPAALRGDALCTLVRAALRQGALTPARTRALTGGLRALEQAAAGAPAQPGGDYQQTVELLADMQKQMYEDARGILDNLKS